MLFYVKALVPGRWPLVSGHWLLVAGLWLLVSLDSRCWILDTRLINFNIQILQKVIEHRETSIQYRLAKATTQRYKRPATSLQFHSLNSPGLSINKTKSRGAFFAHNLSRIQQRHIAVLFDFMHMGVAETDQVTVAGGYQACPQLCVVCKPDVKSLGIHLAV